MVLLCKYFPWILKMNSNPDSSTFHTWEESLGPTSWRCVTSYKYSNIHENSKPTKGPNILLLRGCSMPLSMTLMRISNNTGPKQSPEEHHLSLMSLGLWATDHYSLGTTFQPLIHLTPTVQIISLQFREFEWLSFHSLKPHFFPNFCYGTVIILIQLILKYSF